MSIHQPRSDIYALFDKLLLISDGRLIYYGGAHAEAGQYFESLGMSCPSGYNFADYLRKF